ncbi:MAG: formate dehydrogenase accessory sulfurtransferase FdhD [Urechidicola sp.]|nr:formate dehydrogenase accessory sulfurtransferase FdhD [Urechidicola sp.]
MKSLKYEAVKVSRNKHNLIEDYVVVEAPLQININDEPYTVVMRTPGDDTFLIRGLLFAEDIYKGEENLTIEIIENSEHHFSIVNINIKKKDLGKGYLNKRTLLSVSSCGVCGAQTLDAIKKSGNKLISNTNISPSNILAMFKLMNQKQELFNNTGASHAAAIFDSNYQILSIKEDIGRHNAVDKSIGDLITQKQLSKSNYLLVSGRVSYEIVTKAFIAKIPTIIAVSGCSSLAIDFCKEFGIHLIGFARGNNHTFYTI